jgi:riboflavin synthase
MFTGIVTDLGQVRRVEKRGDTHIVIGTHYEVSEVDPGASIACCGICMTVVDRGNSNDRWFAVTASGETVSRTTAGQWRIGDSVNLERPVRVGDELGGHIVTGHIDGTAELVRMSLEGESTRMIFDAPNSLSPFIASKGSIALDGVSLTVNEVNGARFDVNIIPHTRKVTTFGALKPGAKVNLEVDLLARYVARLAGTR